MGKLLLILVMSSALLDGIASSHSQPPMLIDAPQSTAR
jgi:hypothetical protein